MLAALALAGGVYTVFAPGAFAEDTPQLSGAAMQGKALFDGPAGGPGRTEAATVQA